MKKIIGYILTLVVGVISGGLYINAQNTSTINDLSMTITNLETEIIECESNNIGMKIEAQGDQSSGDVIGVNAVNECQSGQACTGFSVNTNIE